MRVQYHIKEYLVKKKVTFRHAGLAKALLIHDAFSHDQHSPWTPRTHKDPH